MTNNNDSTNKILDDLFQSYRSVQSAVEFLPDTFRSGSALDDVLDVVNRYEVPFRVGDLEIVKVLYYGLSPFSGKSLNLHDLGFDSSILKNIQDKFPELGFNLINKDAFSPLYCLQFSVACALERRTKLTKFCSD